MNRFEKMAHDFEDAWVDVHGPDVTRLVREDLAKRFERAFEEGRKRQDELFKEERAETRNENARLKAEVEEARNEAAACRRAYLHERWRADEACGELVRSRIAFLVNRGNELAEQVYRGPVVLRSATAKDR